MNQVNQNNFHGNSAELPLKRKRGRPRKYPKADVNDNAQIPKNLNLNQNPNIGLHSQIPPVSNGAAVNPPFQKREPVDNANKAMIGQVVSGVVEAVFDAGFLLSVRVGGSDTTLRGVVFSPGRYVPISPDNDVAPDVQMIKRNVIPIPTGCYAHGDSSCSKKRTEQNIKSNRNETNLINGLPAAKQVSRVAGNSSVVTGKGKQVPVVAEQTVRPAGSGGILSFGNQKFDSSNLVTVSDQIPLVVSQASHMLSSKGKEVLESLAPANGSVAICQVPMDGRQSPCTQPQPSSTDSMQNEDSLHRSSSKGQQELEAKTMMSPGMPFETLLPDTMKRIQAPSQTRESGVENTSGNTSANVHSPFEKLLCEALKRVQAPLQTAECGVKNSEASGNTSAKDLKGDQEYQSNNMDQASAIRPLQTRQPHLEEKFPTISKVLETNKTDRMNELLQVLQHERENQERQAGHVLAKKSSESKNHSIEPDYEEAGQLEKISQCSDI